jgi:Ca2+-binding EF-hand superfamily protein
MIVRLSAIKERKTLIWSDIETALRNVGVLDLSFMHGLFDRMAAENQVDESMFVRACCVLLDETPSEQLRSAFELYDAAEYKKLEESELKMILIAARKFSYSHVELRQLDHFFQIIHQLDIVM